MSHARLYRSHARSHARLNGLQKGFHEIIPPHLLKSFDERELELIVSGLGSVDVDDWMNNTRLKHCTQDTDVIQWFWKVWCALNITLNMVKGSRLLIVVENDRWFGIKIPLILIIVGC